MDQLTFGFEHKAIAKDLLRFIEEIQMATQEDDTYVQIYDNINSIFTKYSNLLDDATLALREKS